ncbi:hypothetical protein IVB30_20455 [Bradyrhizobium sp. 200]|uniref:hypothetical protein n=1 Tax=Bradyrhizobium sp. 200 TaxID=2782665 RepID=UPI001FFF070F|nr:hypothetical protein [Bradyrhizobium sp. 200]UPJ53476.1 hypothetical protein IVB30_20455 [Bradyrhizobium sp. 200]
MARLRHTSRLVVLIVARTLSVLSILMTAAAIDSWYIHYLPWGSEGTGFVALISFLLASLFALSALVVAVVRARSGASAGRSQVVLLSGISLVGLAALVAVCPYGC